MEARAERVLGEFMTTSGLVLSEGEANSIQTSQESVGDHKRLEMH